MLDAGDVDTQEKRLVELLSGIDFARRYYVFCDERAGQKAAPDITRADHEKALADTGLTFEYHAKERFYGHREPIGANTLVLNASFSDRNLELILAIVTPAGNVGGTFHGFARIIQEQVDPGWEHSPKYPRVPYHDRDDLAAAVEFGIGLYREARTLILAEQWG